MDTIQDLDHPGPLSGTQEAKAIVAVERYLKSTGESPCTLTSANNSAACGFLESTDEDKRFVLLLKKAENTRAYTSSLCSGNAGMDSTESTQYLSQVEAITVADAPPTIVSAVTKDSPNTLAIWGMGAALLALAAGLLLFFKLRPRSGS